jgi:hypothetical protein
LPGQDTKGSKDKNRFLEWEIRECIDLNDPKREFNAKTSWLIALPWRPRSENYSPYSVANERNVEINEKPETLSAKFQIGQKLSLEQRQESLNRLEFNNDLIINQQVESQPAINSYIVVCDWKIYLALKVNIALVQFVTQTLLVDRFQQSRSQSGVHTERGINNYLRSLVKGIRNWVVQHAVYGTMIEERFSWCLGALVVRSSQSNVAS